MTVYVDCPNGCEGGYVPCDAELTDDGAEYPWSLGSYWIAFINDDENATSHASTCPPLTENQRSRIEEEAAARHEESRYDEP